MTRIFQLTLILTTLCYAQQMHAAGTAGMAGFLPSIDGLVKPENMNDEITQILLREEIIQMLQRSELNQEVTARVSQRPAEKRSQLVRSLFKEFGDRLLKIENINDKTEVDNDWRVIHNLLHVATALKVAQDKKVRNAFFYIPDGCTPLQSMLYRALRISPYPLTDLVAWFPEGDLRSDYMLSFLQEYPDGFKNAFDPHAERKEDQIESEKEDFRKRVLHVCEHIDFDAWQLLTPHMRLLLHGTIDVADTLTLQSFFASQGIVFNEDPKDIERAREAAFLTLIKDLVNTAHVKTSTETAAALEGLASVVQVLANNSHLFRVNGALGLCFFGAKVLDPKTVINPQHIVAYITSLRIYNCFDEPSLKSRVSGVLQRCQQVFPLRQDSSGYTLFPHEFVAACELLIDDPRYADFLARSSLALKKYIKLFASKPEQSMRELPVCAHSAVNNNVVDCDYIRYMLGRPTLTQLLRAHCADDREEFPVAGSSNACVDDPV